MTTVSIHNDGKDKPFSWSARTHIKYTDVAAIASFCGHGADEKEAVEELKQRMLEALEALEQAVHDIGLGSCSIVYAPVEDYPEETAIRRGDNDSLYAIPVTPEKLNRELECGDACKVTEAPHT